MKIKRKFLNIYSDYIKGNISSKRKMRVIFDASNGFSAQVMKSSLKNNRDIEAFYINDKPDGNFPGHGPDPFSAGAMDQVKREVLKNKADLGFIFDADGDRVFAIDNKGRYVHSDFLTKLYIEAYFPKKVVLDRRIGWLVTRELSGKMEIFKSKVGHSYMKDMMKKHSADFGAEESGHYYFSVEGSYMDSGAMMSARLISAISEKKSFSEWIDSQPKYYRFGEASFSVSDISMAIKNIAKYAKEQGFSMDFKDGLSAERQDMQFNVRPSANQPLMRIDAESTSEDVLKKEMQVIQSLIKENKDKERL